MYPDVSRRDTRELSPVPVRVFQRDAVVRARQNRHELVPLAQELATAKSKNTGHNRGEPDVKGRSPAGESEKVHRWQHPK